MLLKKQNGFVLPVTIIIILSFTILVTALLPIVTNEVYATKRDNNMYISQYTAESAVKLAIRYVRSLVAGGTPIGSITGTITGRLSTVAGSPTYTVTYTPDDPTNVGRIRIRAASNVNGITRTANVDILRGNNRIIIPNPGVIPLIQNSNDFSNGRWGISGDPPVANPPSGATNYDNSFHQVLFHEQLSSTRIDIEYNIALDSSSSIAQNNTCTGYGIYYYATGTASNMTSYVFQYDPGANAFFVKKVIAGRNSTTRPELNETRAFNKAFQDNGLDAYGQDRGTALVPLTGSEGLNSIMTAYYAEKRAAGETLSDGSQYPTNFRLEEQRHTIEIICETDTAPTQVITGSYTTGWGRNQVTHYNYASYYLSHHIVKCDGKEILKFTDYDTNYPISRQNACTGVRVWNANVTFNNNIGTASGQTVYQDLLWVK
jgi:hypothetical protein